MKLWQTLLVAGCSTFLLASCGNESTPKVKKGLDPALINNPRSAEGSEAEQIKGLATMDFVDTTHDFGTLHEGETASYDFKFTNNGKAPLLIANAAGTCGCTVPDYPHDPIAPGASAVISVKYNSRGKVGHQNKMVNIFTNSQRGTHSLNIIAEVLEEK
jgi:hypothetical protein